MEETITSGQNPKIKELLALQEKSRERRSAGLFVVEGRRETEHCLEAGFVPDTIFICPEIYLSEGEGVPPEGRATRGTEAGGPRAERVVGSGAARLLKGVQPSPSGPKVFKVSRNVYEKIAYRGSTEGIIAAAIADENAIGIFERTCAFPEKIPQCAVAST